MAVSGTSVAVTAGGFILLYSAIKHATISTTIRSFLAGSPVASAPDSGGGTFPQSYGGGGVSGPPSGGSSGSYFSGIASFLSSRFNKAATAAILGNMEVESGWSPTAYNPGEGAIGFCQWEKGRRLALQAYAAAHGSTETDPEMQLGYMMVELRSPAFAHVYLQIKALPNTESGAAYGAGVWDGQYEISSGDARVTRQNNARRIFGEL